MALRRKNSLLCMWGRMAAVRKSVSVLSRIFNCTIIAVRFNQKLSALIKGSKFGHKVSGKRFTNVLSTFPASVSTESRTLNSTLYNSVDSIDRLLIVRPGMMNRILTKRDGAPYELANWKIYTDYQPIRPDLTSLNFSTVQAPETVSSSIPQLYNVFNFMPVPWWTGTVGATTAISGNGFNSLNLGSRWQALPALELGLGYSYLDGFNYLDALNNQDVTTTGAAQTSLINGSASYRLNESWFANAGVTYSVSPSLLQQVNVGLYRDIGAWILGGQVGNRQNNGAPSEFVALATLTLKAFPDLPLGFNQNPSSSGVGLGGSQPTAGTSP